MDQVSKRRGRPLPGAKSNIKPIIFNLEEALAVENLYRPNLSVIQNDIMPGEVTLKARDGVVHLLRFMRSWFDVPDKIFFTSVIYLDLFIARMKVQEKYLKCLAFACFYAALCKEDINITVTQLVSVSFNNFGIQDVLRLTNIIRDKLKMHTKRCKITTAADILKIYLKFVGSTNSKFRETLNQGKLLTRLELLMADSSCAFLRPSTLAFTLLRLEVDRKMSGTISTKPTTHISQFVHTYTVMKELQWRCKVKSSELVSCSHHASRILKQYHNKERCPNGMFLKWKCIPFAYKATRTPSTLEVIKERPNDPIREKSFTITRERTFVLARERSFTIRKTSPRT